MTNFEQWRETLTAEKLVQYFADGFFDNCDCPAFEFCEENMPEYNDCFDVFIAWANLPHKQ